MLSQSHLDTLASAPALHPAVWDYFLDQGLLSYSGDLGGDLSRAGLGQADLVLALMSVGTPGAMAMVCSLLAGRFTLCPPFVPPRTPLRVRPSALTPDEACRVAAVNTQNPRLPTSPAAQRFREFRPGRTVAQLLRRGVTRRDLREARRHNWVSFEEVQP